MTRVIHTADTHVGYRQYHSPERRRDFLAAFEQVVDDAVEAGVDAVVHAGDIFHDRRPDLPDLLGTIQALRDLAAADIPFLAVVGNHEDKREAQWLDLFEQLGLATRLDAAGNVVGDVTFYGLDYVPRSQREDLDYEFGQRETEHAALVAHGLFEPFAHADWDTERLLSEASVDFDALLLGDNHHPDTAVVADTWVTYAGSSERVSAEEEADRGYNVVTFEDSVDIARRGLPTRDFAFVDVELRAEEGVERVRDRIREHDVGDAVVYVRIDGAGDPITPAPVETFASEQGALVARVNDHRAVEEPDADLDVSFADPDDAVRERVRDLGLSGAARDVDETVRDGGVADSNVRDSVRDRIESLLDDDPGAFDRVPDDRPGDDQPPDADASDDRSSVDAGTDGQSQDGATVDDQRAADSTNTGDPDETAPNSADESSPDGVDPGSEPATDEFASEPPHDDAADSNGGVAADAGEDGPDESSADEASPEQSGDEQASMEEYL